MRSLVMDNTVFCELYSYWQTYSIRRHKQALINKHAELDSCHLFKNTNALQELLLGQ